MMLDSISVPSRSKTATTSERCSSPARGGFDLDGASDIERNPAVMLSQWAGR